MDLDIAAPQLITVPEFDVPTGKHLDSILDSDARLNIWHGAVRSAKTISSIFRWGEFILKEIPPHVPLMMFGNTLETLTRNVIDPMARIFPGEVEERPGINEVYFHGRRIYTMGAGDIRAFRRVRGITLGGAYVDEGSLVSEKFFNLLLSRLSADGAKLFLTTNPETPTHWLHRWIKRIQAGEIDGRVFHFLLDDNPHLSPEYVAALKAEYIGVWYRRYILGQWVAAEGAIWPNFDPAIHVVSELPSKLRSTRVGMDYGTVNPTVGLLGGVGTLRQGEPERLYIAREWRWDSKMRGKQLTDAEQAKGVMDWVASGFVPPVWHEHHGKVPARTEPSGRYVIDPSAASLILTLHNSGVSNLSNADNQVDLGLRSVGNLIGADRLRIHESCVETIEEMMSYSWDDKATERGEEKPVKEADHGPDALRYLIMDLWTEWRKWVKAA